MDVNTRGGVFGPGGRGGGVFDGSGMGFGGLGSASLDYEQAALGLLEPAGQTWNTQLYSECMAKKIEQCGAKYSGSQLTECIDMMQLDCIATALNQLESGATTAAYPWLTYSADTKALQTRINAELDQLGYEQIGTDGKLGPATCGGLRVLYRETGGEWLDLYGGNCQSYSEPAKIGEAPPPVPAPVPQPAPVIEPVVPKKKGMSAAWMVGGLAAAALAGVLYMSAKKKQR